MYDTLSMKMLNNCCTTIILPSKHIEREAILRGLQYGYQLQCVTGVKAIYQATLGPVKCCCPILKINLSKDLTET